MTSFENDLRAAMHASAAAVAVPPCPARVSRLHAAPPRRNAWWPAAVAASIMLTFAATDAGRSAIAHVVTHSVEFFRPADQTPRALSVSEAIRTASFPAVAPRGLPRGARLASVRRIDPDSTDLLFQYVVRAKAVEVLEVDPRGRWPISSPQARRAFHAVSSLVHQPGVAVAIGGAHGPVAVIRSEDAHLRFGRGVNVIVTAERGALTPGEVDAILDATAGR